MLWDTEDTPDIDAALASHKRAVTQLRSDAFRSLSANTFGEAADLFVELHGLCPSCIEVMYCIAVVMCLVREYKESGIWTQRCIDQTAATTAYRWNHRAYPAKARPTYTRIMSGTATPQDVEDIKKLVLTIAMEGVFARKVGQEGYWMEVLQCPWLQLAALQRMEIAADAMPRVSLSTSVQLRGREASFSTSFHQPREGVILQEPARSFVHDVDSLEVLPQSQYLALRGQVPRTKAKKGGRKEKKKEKHGQDANQVSRLVTCQVPKKHDYIKGARACGKNVLQVCKNVLKTSNICLFWGKLR